MTILRRIKYLILIHKQELLTVLFVIILPFITFGIALVTHKIEHKVIVNHRIFVADEGFKADMQYALDKTKDAAQDGAIRDSIAKNDVNKTSVELGNLVKKYNLGTMVAVNSDGLALTRVPSQKKGDFVFQTTPWGREVAQGKEVVMVGEGRSYPLVINAAAPIIKDNTIQGAIFGGYILNNAYAREFKEKYLKPIEEVAFYSIKDGVYGTSLNDPETERLFKLLFNNGSDAIQLDVAGLNAGHFKIGNRIFHVGNIKINDMSGQKIGGIFVLTPAHTNAPPTVAGLLGIILLIPLFIHVREKHKSKWTKIVIIITSIALIVGGVAMSLKSIESFLYHNIPPYTIYNSTMGFYPDSDVLIAMAPQEIGIQITTGGEEINAAQASIKYDPTQIRIEDIIMDNSFCNQQFVIEKTIDNDNGVATIACIKEGGFSADKTLLAELLIQPLRLGETTLQFIDNTSVLANDGVGTNVLRKVTNGSYQFIATSSDNITNNGVILFSYSHPNTTRWYNKKNVHVEWINFEDYKDFKFSFDQSPNTVPDGRQTTNKTSVDFKVTDDGVYYFHLTPLSSKDAAKTTHLRILVDTTPPIPVNIQMSATEIKTNDVLLLKFIGVEDTMSGLQKNFYIQFDNGTWFPTVSTISIPFLEAGNHKISVRVFDNAGNFTDTISSPF